MGKKIDKGNHIGRAGDKEQRKDQHTEIRKHASKRAEQRSSRGMPPIRKKK